MVDGNYFKKLEYVARKVKNSDKPFGGIQLIMCGDFFQLPPVSKGKEQKTKSLQDKSSSKSAAGAATKDLDGEDLAD